MARKRNKRSKETKSQSEARADWQQEDEIELLAWLDCILGRSEKKDASLFKPSFVEYLKDSRRKTYTEHQIERKIKKLWAANRADDANDPNEIWKVGTKCLPHLSDVFREQIDRRLSKLQKSKLTNILDSERMLRSASRGADWDLSRHISLGIEVAETPSPRKRYRESHSSSVVPDELRPRKRRDGDEKLLRVSQDYPGQKPPKQEDETHAIGPQFLLRVVVNSEDGHPEVSEEDHDSPTIRISNKDDSSISTVKSNQMSQNEEIEVSMDTRSMGKEQNAAFAGLQRDLFLSQDRCEISQEQQKQYEKTILSLRRELSTAVRDSEALQVQLHCTDSACRQLTLAGQESVIGLLTDSMKDVSELQELLDDKERLRSFSTLSSTDPITLDGARIRAELASIGDNIKALLSDYDDDFPCIAPRFELRSGLNSLFHRGFGQNLPGFSTSSDQALDLSTFSFQAVTRTLIASALCEWVFESDLPDISGTPCALLKTYRSHLAKQDGEIALRNLDFAAHASLIEDSFFQQHIIPAKAAVLAERLIHTLTPVFVQVRARGIAHAEILRAWHAKELLLEELFEQALRIKAQATISKDLFEMVLYSPGTPFDREVMQAETMEGVRVQVPSSTTSTVRLCLLPSLHLYEHDTKLVTYNNFLRKADGRRSEAIKITKAVVVLENAQPAIY